MRLHWLVAQADRNIYVVTVIATDSGNLMDTHSYGVGVTNVNEAPVFDSGPTGTLNYNENQDISTVVATYEASDVDATTTLNWTLEGNDASDFTITDSDSDGDYELRFKVSPNFEDPHDANSDKDFNVIVKVTDNGIPENRGSTLNVTRPLTIRLVDVNDPPVVSGDQSPSEPEIEFDDTSPDLSISTYTYTDEDVPADTIQWSVAGTDAADFSINMTTGALSFSGHPDFENPTDRANMTDGHDASNNTYEIILQGE